MLNGYNKIILQLACERIHKPILNGLCMGLKVWHKKIADKFAFNTITKKNCWVGISEASIVIHETN